MVLWDGGRGQLRPPFQKKWLIMKVFFSILMLVLPFFAKAQNGGGGSFADVVRVIPRPFTFSQIFPVGNKDFLRNAFVKQISGGDTIIFFVDTYGNFVRVGGGTGGGGGGGTVTSVGLSLPGSFSVVGSPVTGAGTLTATWLSQNQNSFLLSPSSAPGAPTFRTMVAADLPAIVDSTKVLTGAISLDDIGQRGASSGQVIGWNGTAWRPATPAAGSVTSVGLSLPGSFSVVGTPVTGAGTLTATWLSQNQNRFLLSPSSGSGAPTFRTMVAADLPAIVDSTKALTGAISLNNIGQRGAAFGQVVRWNGSAWRPGEPTVSTLPPILGDGSGGSPLEIVSGGITNALLNSSAVDSTKVLNGAISMDDIGQRGASSGQVIGWNGTAWRPATPAGGGTVTSVGLSLPGTFLVSGTPVTGAGTLTANWITQNQNSFLLSPSSAPGTPTFRTMVAADLPAIVDSTKVVDGAISLDDIGQRGASSGQVIGWNGTAWRPATPAAGAVTSVGLSLPGTFLVSGTPVTGAGTLTANWITQNQNSFLLSPSSAPGTPTFRTMVAADLPAIVDSTKAVDGAISLDDIGQRGASTGQVVRWNGTAWRPTTPTAGTVTSVGLSLPAGLSVSGTPVTGAGTLTGAWLSQSQNRFLISPASSGGTPTFRIMAAADLPAIVDSTKVLTGAISLDDIGQRGASSGQVIGWNGSAWRPETVRISATASLDFPSTATGAVSDLTLALSGAVLGDAVCIGVPNVSVAGSTMYSGWVSASNTVTIRFLNVGSAQDPAAGTFRATIVR